MITFVEASDIAREYAAAIPVYNIEPLVVDTSKTVAKSYGWIFWTQTRAYLETQEFKKQVIDAPCFVVLRSDGSVIRVQKDSAFDTREDRYVEFEVEHLGEMDNISFTEVHHNYIAAKCASEGNASNLLKIISDGFDLNKVVWQSKTLLMCAVEAENIDIIQLLMERGADVNVQNDCGHTALMYATWRARADIVQMLLTYGANPNLLTVDNKIAIDFAEDSFATIIAMLQAASASRTQKNSFAQNLLHRFGRRRGKQ